MSDLLKEFTRFIKEAKVIKWQIYVLHFNISKYLLQVATLLCKILKEE